MNKLFLMAAILLSTTAVAQAGSPEEADMSVGQSSDIHEARSTASPLPVEVLKTAACQLLIGDNNSAACQASPEATLVKAAFTSFLKPQPNESSEARPSATASPTVAEQPEQDAEKASKPGNLRGPIVSGSKFNMERITQLFSLVVDEIKDRFGQRVAMIVKSLGEVAWKFFIQTPAEGTAETK
ncbi:MAG: hypothetical protein J0G29_00755 [Alphaproteobacteria bacterium]|nr:hypothetical protein [Alphaproteobacteria bacterium]OJV45652.1 MAG: hypothetical protein BGO28_02190 [Alphaproteobacteria bacterium 43-37]